MMRRIFLILILLLFPVAVFAGEYVLVKGKGVEVCEEYGKNLNSLQTMSNWPVPFGKINPEFRDFSKPKWENLMDVWSDRVPRDANPHLKISDFFWKRDVNPVEFFRGDASKWRGTKKQYAEAYKRYSFFRHEINPRQVPNNHLVAEIDIDNDSTPEPVYLDQMYPLLH